jgi:hypothetical protein
MGQLVRVHCRHCGQTYFTTSADLPQCDMCREPGGLVSGEDAILAAEMAPLAPPQPFGTYPVSRTCPKCGGAEYRRVAPQRLIAFVSDRVCKSCSTRYTPPTPGWAGVVFILVGLLLAGVGLFDILVGLARGNPFPPVCSGALGLLGVVVIAHGIRSLMSPGRV